MKTCCTCKQEKGLASFTKCRTHDDGLDRRCRDCSKLFAKKTREREKAGISPSRARRGSRGSDGVSVVMISYQGCDDEMFGEDGFYPGGSWEELWQFE